MKRLITVLILLLLGGLFGCSSIENVDSSSSPSLTSPAFDNKETPTGEIPRPTAEPSDGEYVNLPVQISPEVAVEPETESAEEDNAEMEVSDIDFSQPGVYEITSNVIYSVDVNEDGVMESIFLYETGDDQFSYLALSVNGTAYDEMSVRKGDSDAYIIKKESGDVGLIISGQDQIDYESSYIYGFNNSKAVLFEEPNYEIKSLTMDSLTLYGVDFLFGNLTVSIDCVLNDDFTLTYGNDGFFEIHKCLTGDYLVTKIDIPVQMLEVDVYTDSILPAGSRIYLKQYKYTDREYCVIFETEDGSTGRLFADGNKKINGIDEYDIFEDIIYAGP